jgi:DNA-binding NarL/FixJ family response regulator
MYSDIVSIVDNKDIDVVFLDSNLVGLNVMEYLGLLKEKKSAIKILIMLNSPDSDRVINALCLGVKGCLGMDSNKDEFVQAVRAVNNEEIWADVGLISRALNKLLNTKKFSLDDLKHKLTKKEERIARLILQGHSNKDIGKELFISEKTVKTHVGHIFRKLGIKSRFQLTANYFSGEAFTSES